MSKKRYGGVLHEGWTAWVEKLIKTDEPTVTNEAVRDMLVEIERLETKNAKLRAVAEVAVSIYYEVRTMPASNIGISWIIRQLRDPLRDAGMLKKTRRSCDL